MRARSRPITVDIVDETFIDVPPPVLSTLVADARNQRQWWPHLQLSTVRDRGVKGQKWDIAGEIVGTMEIWLEPFWEGVIVHHFVRGHVGARGRRDVATRHTLRWKRSVTGLKDLLERRAL